MENQVNKVQAVAFNHVPSDGLSPMNIRVSEDASLYSLSASLEERLEDLKTKILKIHELLLCDEAVSVLADGDVCKASCRKSVRSYLKESHYMLNEIEEVVEQILKDLGC